MSGICILIVDESRFFREILSRELNKKLPDDSQIVKVSDGHEALRKIEAQRPDAVLVSMQISGIGGDSLLRELKTKYMLDAVAISTKESDRSIAMNAGAADFIIKPIGLFATRGEFLNLVSRKLLDSAKGESRFAATNSLSSWCSLIAIGSSTGGTEALTEVFSKLRPPMPPIAVVQHISPKFSKLFAERLNRECTLSVKEAENGDKLEDNHVYIAPGDKHMSVSGNVRNMTLKCESGPPIHGVHSSADVLFESVANVVGNKAVGVILTGMGVDGAAKLLEMRETGARTLGQDEDSCVVYGMPKAAFNMGAVEKQVSIDDMAKEITSLVRNV